MTMNGAPPPDAPVNGAPAPGPANGAPAPVQGTNIVRLSTSAIARARRREAQMLPEPEMRSLEKAKMAEWIFEQTDARKKKRQCVMFLLSHEHRTNGIMVITSSDVLSKTAGEDERRQFANQTVDLFDEESHNRADKQPDVQSFLVSACPSDDPDKDPINTRSFLVSPRPEHASSAYQSSAKSTSDIDATAIVGQMQRHVDSSLRQLTDTMQAMQERLIDWNSRVMAHNEVLENSSFEKRLRMEELADNRSLREAEALERKMMVDAQWLLIQGGLKYAGAFADRYLATKTGPGDKPKEDPALKQLTEFMQILEPAQFMMIFQGLTDAQRDAFAPIAMKMVASMPREKQELVMGMLKLYQEHQAAQKLAEEEGAKIKITVQEASSNKDADK